MKLNDLSGQKFGRLTVLEKVDSQVTPNGTKRTMWKCQCDCGNVVIRSQQNIRTAKHASCGCWKSELTSERKLEDFRGQRFGRLTVIEKAEKTHMSTRWRCKCDCGNEITVIAQNLKRGHTMSCGCYRDEVRPKQQFKHGYRHSRIYSVYSNIKDRCYNPNNPRYYRYGGRGISLCTEWLDDPKAFCDWAYANGYKEDVKYGECTIDRIDNDKGYSPDNCRIVGLDIQANNTSKTKHITHNNETKTITEWSNYFGIPRSKLYRLLVIRKKTIQDLLEEGYISYPN